MDYDYNGNDDRETQEDRDFGLRLTKLQLAENIVVKLSCVNDLSKSMNDLLDVCARHITQELRGEL